MAKAIVLDGRATGVKVRTVLSIFKLRIGLEITLAMVAGVAATPGRGLSGSSLTALALAVLLASASAGAFNQYAERELDAGMSRTRRRPFATGELAAGARWPVLFTALLVAAVAMALYATNLAAACQVFLGAVTYGIVYTLWLKRRTWLNVVFGGFAGTFALLAGTLAVNPHLSLEPAMLAIAMFFWTPPHFWSLALYGRQDYQASGIPMLPAVASDRLTSWAIFGHTILLVAFSLIPALTGLGALYGLCAGLGGAWFLRCGLRLLRHPSRASALANFHASLIQLSLLLIGSIADGLLHGRLIT